MMSVAAIIRNARMPMCVMCVWTVESRVAAPVTHARTILSDGGIALRRFAGEFFIRELS